MAYTQAQYDELKAAIARGVKSVGYGDKRVEYRTLEEMRSLLNEMAGELGIDTGTRRLRRTYAAFDKGHR